ncbi:MAG TPA: extensin family protein, partial [Povalibacter sp.]
GTRWSFTPIDDEVTRPGCGYSNAVRIQHMDAAVSEPFAVSCREALSLALWERHVLQPAARKHFGAPVTRIDHFGSYSCRSVYGRPNANMSHHATADAIDVAGFVIGEGKRVRVLGDWPGDSEEAQFLRDVHNGACDFFDSVLGPEYNIAHRDHFHLDRGAFRACH